MNVASEAYKFIQCILYGGKFSLVQNFAELLATFVCTTLEEIFVV
jgi:hypothetical protein